MVQLQGDEGGGVGVASKLNYLQMVQLQGGEGGGVQLVGGGGGRVHLPRADGLGVS